MTDVATTGGTIALPEEDILGLEDFDLATEGVMPTLRIDHDKGVFVDGLSGEEFDKFHGILLGLIKQRVLWDAEVDESSKGPLCRSYDFHVGRPDSDRFPWKSSGFAKPEEEITLPCATCKLKDWGSHPNRGDTPWCSEQHTFAVLQPVGDGGLVPALLTVQRSAIKPSRTYLTSFKRSRTPLFTVYTTITLDHRRKGSVDFAVPKFIRGEATPEADWPSYAQQTRQIRDYVQTPRGQDAEEETVDPPTPAAAPAPATTTASSPTSTSATTTGATVPTAPVVTTVPVASTEAPAAPVVTTPPAATAAPVAATASPPLPDEDDDDLPF